MPHHPKIMLTVNQARYIPSRHPLDSEMGIVNATTSILLQKMIADSYEQGRIIWRENKARCELTGELESNDMPCGPNPAQKKVAEWLVSAGLLDPDELSDDEEEDGSENSIPPSPLPQTPARRSWHRRLQIVIPSKENRTPSTSESPASPLQSPSPKSPFCPSRVWSAVQRSTTSLPMLQLKPSIIPSPPATSTPPCAPPRKKCRSLDSGIPQPTKSFSADPKDTLLETAFKRAAQLESITPEDVDIILKRHRDPLPPGAGRRYDDATWYVPAIEVPPEPVTKKGSKPKPRPKSLPLIESLPWPEPIVPPTPAHPPIEDAETTVSKDCPDLRWYHPFVVLLMWYLFIITFSSYVVLRLVLKPMLCLVALYYLFFACGFLASVILP